jgi:hypothetical protein
MDRGLVAADNNWLLDLGGHLHSDGVESIYLNDYLALDGLEKRARQEEK